MKRAVGYVRESTEEQGQNWAPDVQRKAIERYAAEQEWQLAGLYQDFVSGRNAEKRPDFQRLLRHAAERRFEVVLVYHSSRFARNVFESRQHKDYLRKRLGIEVISVSQRFGESDDPSNFLMESINEVLDEHYSRNLGFLVAAGLREKASQGYIIGSLPFGYRRPKGETRRVELQPDEAATVRQVFEEYASGTRSYAELADWLNAAGHRGHRGKPFTKETVRDVLVNSTYAGYVSPRRAPLDPAARGNHEPIVSRELFERVQAVRARRNGKKHGTRPSRHNYVLTGTAVCDRCGTSLYGSRGGNGNRYARYLCAGRTRRHCCDQPQALARKVEGQLTEFLRDFRLGASEQQAVLARLRERTERRAAEAERPSLTELRGRLARLQDLYELGDLSRNDFLKRKAKVVALMADAEPLPEPDLERCLGLLHNFSDLWEHEPNPKERQQFVRLVFERVAIDAGQIVSVTPREDVLPLFTERKGVHSGRGWFRTTDLSRVRRALSH